MLAATLEACGVFMGAVLDEHHESAVFQAINRELLDRLGCSWRAIDYLPSVDALSRCAAHLAPRVAARLERDMKRGYWKRGWWRPRRWGFKDPRTSILLPVWHRVFPDATVVHIVRDGRSVARSLYERDMQTLGGDGALPEHELRARYLGDVALWEAYERRIRAALPAFGRPVSVRYETLVEAPAAEIARLVQELRLSVRSVDDVARSIVRARDARPWPASGRRPRHG